MTLFCSICGKEVKSWIGMYENLKRVFIAYDQQGNPCHKVCYDGAMKNAFNKAARVPVPMWQANDPQSMSGSELGRVRRALKYKL
jgi:hypothetical protein